MSRTYDWLVEWNKAYVEGTVSRGYPVIVCGDWPTDRKAFVKVDPDKIIGETSCVLCDNNIPMIQSDAGIGTSYVGGINERDDEYLAACATAVEQLDRDAVDAMFKHTPAMLRAIQLQAEMQHEELLSTHSLCVNEGVEVAAIDTGNDIRSMTASQLNTLIQAQHEQIMGLLKSFGQHLAKQRVAQESSRLDTFSCQEAKDYWDKQEIPAVVDYMGMIKPSASDFFAGQKDLRRPDFFQAVTGGIRPGEVSVIMAKSRDPSHSNLTFKIDPTFKIDDRQAVGRALRDKEGRWTDFIVHGDREQPLIKMGNLTFG